MELTTVLIPDDTYFTEFSNVQKGDTFKWCDSTYIYDSANLYRFNIEDITLIEVWCYKISKGVVNKWH